MSESILLRRASIADAVVIRSLVTALVGRTPYTELLSACVEAALPGSDEARAMLAERNGEVVGIVVYGAVAGARGAAKLHLVAVSAAGQLRGTGAQLVEAAVDELQSHGARLVVVEMPDDPLLTAARALLERCGFTEEARIPDFYRDGIALSVLRRTLVP